MYDKNYHAKVPLKLVFDDTKMKILGFIENHCYNLQFKEENQFWHLIVHEHDDDTIDYGVTLTDHVWHRQCWIQCAWFCCLQQTKGKLLLKCTEVLTSHYKIQKYSEAD